MLQVDQTLAGTIVQLWLQPGIYDATSSASRRQLQGQVESDTFDVYNGFVFDNRTLASEIVIEAENGVIFHGLPSAQPILSVLPGAPPVIVNGGIFERSHLAPAISVQGSQLTLNACNLLSSADSALQVTGGGHAIVRRSQLTDNGRHDKLCGGAIQAVNGSLDITDSVFEGNTAVNGGGLCLLGSSFCSLSRSVVRLNNAMQRGGGLYMGEQANGLLSNETALVDNTALHAFNIDVSSGLLQYALPAPLGHWVSNVRRASTTSNLMVSVLPLGPLDDNFPYGCAPGIVGSNNDVSSQDGPDCTAPCVSTIFTKSKHEPLICTDCSLCACLHLRAARWLPLPPGHVAAHFVSTWHLLRQGLSRASPMHCWYLWYTTRPHRGRSVHDLSERQLVW